MVLDLAEALPFSLVFIQKSFEPSMHAIARVSGGGFIVHGMFERTLSALAVSYPLIFGLINGLYKLVSELRNVAYLKRGLPV